MKQIWQSRYYRGKQAVRAAVLMALTLTVAPGAWAQFTEAARQVGEATVTINHGEHTGTGFIISTQGHILTNRHVVQQADEVTVKLRNNESLLAKTIINAPDLDLSVVQIERSGLPTVQFASSAGVKQGDEVATLGAPLGLEDSLTRGIVSNARREMEGQAYLQIDAALNAGNSGGPIINTAGLVIGIATRSVKDGQNLGFAIPSDEIMNYLRESEIPFSAALGQLPEAVAAPGDGGAAMPPAADAAAPPTPGELPPPPPEPTAAQISWLTVAVSAAVALIVALITSLVLLRQKQLAASSMLGEPASSPGSVASPPGQTLPPAARPVSPPEDDLSDIDIEFK